MADLTPQACRAARGLLDWGVRELGAEAGIGPDSISAYERGGNMRSSNKAKIVSVLAAHGVEITNGAGTGARLRKTS